MPSSSRRGSYTSGNNSSHSSIDSTGLSQSTHSQSQSRNNSTGGEYDTLYGATLYLDGMMAAAAHDKSSPEKIANNVYSNPPVQERTLTRTQDFMVVPSEVVYGPGGEKINKGIAYTALDGRMSSFKIPVSSSSYQEEAELRRLKREKAMMKSKLMRPCTERSASNPNGSGIIGGKSRPGSRTSIQRYKDGSTRASMASNASSGHTSVRRKSLTGDKEKGSRSDSSTANVIGSPHSTLLLNGSNSSIIILQPMEGLAPLVRPRSSGLSSQYLAKSGWRRESITSIGSHDSVSCYIITLFYSVLFYTLAFFTFASIFLFSLILFSHLKIA